VGVEGKNLWEHLYCCIIPVRVAVGFQIVCVSLFVFSFLEFQILVKNPKSDFFASFVGCATGISY